MLADQENPAVPLERRAANLMKSPNILLILADDHGSWATGCYGNSEVRTPNLDYLAATGVRFANAFTPCPVCSPARASLFTGRIPSQHGLHDFLSEEITEMDEADTPWLEREIFLSEYLQQQGYQTALIGKWHCTIDGHRPQRGFDYWVSYDVRERGWINQYQHRGPVDFTVQGQRETAYGFQSQYLTDKACSFLHNRNRERPFFLVLSLIDTHFPFAGQPERLVAPYRHPEQPHADLPRGERSHLVTDGTGGLLPDDHHERVAQYYAGVSMIDHQVGTLLDHLEGEGVLDDTLVIYTADHGHMNGQHGLYGKGNATTPQNFYEESIRIPLLMRWPVGNMQPTIREEPVDLCDLFVTMVDAAGASPTPSEAAMINSPGRSLLPLLHGEMPAWRAYQWCEYGNARMVTDLRYKLVNRYPPHSDGYADELFDLTLDPRESINLIGDPDYQPIVQQFQQALDRFYAQYEVPAVAGTNILALPPHNSFEPWRK